MPYHNGMTLAKDINTKLDEILTIKAEINRMDNDLPDDEILTNIQTGEKQTKQDALKLIDKILDEIKFDLNEITNNGLNVNGIFTNKYYINDLAQDRVIANTLPKPPNFSDSGEINTLEEA